MKKAAPLARCGPIAQTLNLRIVRSNAPIKAQNISSSLYLTINLKSTMLVVVAKSNRYESPG